MESTKAVELAELQGMREVARAIVGMARKGGWGHVTIRFHEGEIRQVDTLETVRVEGEAAARAA